MRECSHRTLTRAVADTLAGGDASKSAALRRHDLADDEATAATLGIEPDELPARPVTLDLRVYAVDDAGNRTRIEAAPDAVARFNALVDALPDPNDADAWKRRTKAEVGFLEREQ